MDKQTRDMLWMAGAGVGGFLAARMLKRALGGYDFASKRVLITGGSRGLGLLLAREFSRRGALVAICARNVQELEAAREDLEAHGAREVVTVPCDVTDKQQVARMVRRVREELGGIDILVNNAGIIQVGPVEEMRVEDFEQAMAVHFYGPLYTTLAVLPEMRERRSGRIVNITSIGGKVSMPHLLPYGASKFALVGLSQGLHAELAKDGIRVTTVVPGLMRTGSPVQAQFKGRNEEEFAWFATADSLRITSMNAEHAARDIAEAVRQGEAEITLSLQAKALETLHALAPGMMSDLLGVVNRALPRPGGIGKEQAKGGESRPEWLAESLTRQSDAAAQRHNELQNQMWI